MTLYAASMQGISRVIGNHNIIMPIATTWVGHHATSTMTVLTVAQLAVMETLTAESDKKM